jgi:sporulation protein YlmC with PRC-barrel domain
MRYLMTAGALALSLVSSTTLAETAQPSGQTTQQAPKQMETQTAQAGMQEATPSTRTVKFVNVQPADVMAYDLLGTDVYNNQDENIGEIEDMVIDNGKTVSALIISVGGFLGMGERYVAVDPSTVTLVPEDDNDMRAIVNTNRDDLKGAPTFKYERTDRP